MDGMQSNGLIPIDHNLSSAMALEESSHMPLKCNVCKKEFSDPVILSCLHVFDRGCLRPCEQHDDLVSFVKCPTCDAISGSLKTLPSYNTSLVDASGDQDTSKSDSVVQCSVCTDGNEALYRCLHCAGTLCERCRDVHKVMKLFSNHEILVLTEEERKHSDILRRTMQNTKPVPCSLHADHMYTTFCVQCHVPLCEACVDSDHKGHVTSALNSVSKHVDSLVSNLTEMCMAKQKELKQLTDNLHSVLSDISASRDRNRSVISETYSRWKSAVETIRDQFLQRNSELHDELEMNIWTQIYSFGEKIDHMDYACEFVRAYLKKCSNVEMCKLMKSISACFDRLSKTQQTVPDNLSVNFVSKTDTEQDLIRQHFGTFDTHADSLPDLCLPNMAHSTSHAPDLSAFNGLSEDLNQLHLSNGSHRAVGSIMHALDSMSPANDLRSIHDSVLTTLANGGESNLFNASAASCSVVTNRSAASLWTDSTTPDTPESGYFPSTPTIPPSFVNPNFVHTDPGNNNVFRPISSVFSMPDGELDAPLYRQKFPMHQTSSLYEYCRMRSARSNQMNLLAKWGSLGCELSRLNSPHGFCLGFDEEIVVADTNNHRIQIFSKRGDFVSFFGVSGRVDGLLWYPRKVAIIRQSQRYVVCDRGNERSRMQLFSRSGHFVRRVPIRYIDIVAGLAINQHGHIVAVDSVSPSVFVVSEDGDLIRWFDCSSQMREPSDIAIHGSEYYICDFKAHCVIVFQEDGTFLRRIGGETITDFPNGIDVSDHGDVLVGDSHGNRFHVAVFNRTGELLSEFVCNQTKVSRSCCLKITTEGYVVTLARNSNNVLVLDTLYICQNGPTM